MLISAGAGVLPNCRQEHTVTRTARTKIDSKIAENKPPSKGPTHVAMIGASTKPLRTRWMTVRVLDFVKWKLKTGLFKSKEIGTASMTATPADALERPRQLIATT